DPPGGEGAVAEQEGAADQPDGGQRPRPRHHDRADSADAQADEQGVRQGADADDGEDRVPADALAQDEGVLGADGDDEGEAGAESGDRGGQGVGHALDARQGITVRTAKDFYVPLALLMTPDDEGRPRMMSELPLDQVRTLLAVVDEGTFDAAAAALHLT